MLHKTAMLRLRQAQGAQCLIKKYRAGNKKAQPCRQAGQKLKTYLNTFASFLSKAAPLKFLPTTLPSGSIK
jgi:uncharacterized protein YbgA (DUF1722 family)